MACKPEHHFIELDPRHRIEAVIVLSGTGTRYIPQYLADTGKWMSLPTRFSIREARNDCAEHAEKGAVE